MHELSLAQSVWNQVSEEMRRHEGRRLLAVEVAVGALSGVEPESFKFAMGLVLEDSPWPDARVDVSTEPVVLACRKCGKEFPVDGLDFVCPTCGSRDCDAVRGTNLRLCSVEIE